MAGPATTANAAVACSSFLMLPPVAQTTRRKLIACSVAAAVATGTNPPSERGCHNWFGGGSARFARDLRLRLAENVARARDQAREGGVELAVSARFEYLNLQPDD